MLRKMVLWSLALYYSMKQSQSLKALLVREWKESTENERNWHYCETTLFCAMTVRVMG